MPNSWFEPLRPLCKEACLAASSVYPISVVLFYLARWCQKEAKEKEPDFDPQSQRELSVIAEKIARNLADDGARVDRLVEGDAETWTDLRRELVPSARRGGAKASEYVEEALQRIAIVLLMGTPPSQAASQLERELSGPASEYVFQSPFTPWARQVVRNLVIDDLRRAQREREARPATSTGHKTRQRTITHIDSELLKRATEALPSLLDAIRELPPAQRLALTFSLMRRDLDEMVVERLHELAPDLFSEAQGERPSSDTEIAERLDTTAHRVAANRYAARRKLVAQNPLWALLLDALLPHRSARRIRAERGAQTRSATGVSEANG